MDKVAFTGSTEVGKLILQAAAGNLKKVSLRGAHRATWQSPAQVGALSTRLLRCVRNDEPFGLKNFAFTTLVFRCIQMIHCCIALLVFPAKAGTHFCHRHRLSPV